jgi:hypothetical protein
MTSNKPFQCRLKSTKIVGSPFIAPILLYSTKDSSYKTSYDWLWEKLWHISTGKTSAKLNYISKKLNSEKISGF